MERVWTEPGGFASVPTSFAGVAHDDDARATPRLCVLGEDGALRGYALRKKKGDVHGSSPPRLAFAHANARTAAVLKATRAPLRDLLFVTDEGGMALACGARVAIAWRADTPLFVSENDVSENENAETVETCFSTEPRVCVGDIARLHSPVGARVTAELKSERRGASSSVRLVIPGAPTSPATRALAAALGGDAFEALGADVGEAARAEAMEIVLSAAAEAASPEDEWDRRRPRSGVVRVRASRRTLGRGGSETIFEDSPRGEAAVSDADDDDDDAWEYLLRSARHASDASRYPSLAAAAASESARTSNAARAGRRKTPKSAEKRVPAASPTPRSELAAPRLSAAHVARAMALLRAAHAAYEACKLDVLLRPCLVDLRSVCVRAAIACSSQFSSADPTCARVAAEAAAFLDHHARDAWFDDASLPTDSAPDFSASDAGSGAYRRDAYRSGGCSGIDRATARLAASTLAKAGTWAANAPGGVHLLAPDACAALEELFLGTATGATADESGPAGAVPDEASWLALVPPLVRAEMVPIRGAALERGVQRGPRAMETDRAETKITSSGSGSGTRVRAAGSAVRWARSASRSPRAPPRPRAAARGDPGGAWPRGSHRGGDGFRGLPPRRAGARPRQTRAAAARLPAAVPRAPAAALASASGALVGATTSPPPPPRRSRAPRVARRRLAPSAAPPPVRRHRRVLPGGVAELGALDPRARTAFGDGDDAGLDAETPGSTAAFDRHGAGVGSVRKRRQRRRVRFGSARRRGRARIPRRVPRRVGLRRRRPAGGGAGSLSSHSALITQKRSLLT